jgi:hypothetical protein
MQHGPAAQASKRAHGNAAHACFLESARAFHLSNLWSVKHASHQIGPFYYHDDGSRLRLAFAVARARQRTNENASSQL